MSTSTSSSSLQKKTQNKIYRKAINTLIEKIIRSKKNTFRLTKSHINQNNSNNVSSNHNPNLDKSSNKETEIKSVKITKQYHTKCQNQSGNSSMNEAVSLIIANTSNAKIIEFNKQLQEILENFKINANRVSGVIEDIMNYLKQENNLSNIVFDNESFVTNIFELISLINFDGIKTAPKYKVTDMNYNSIESALNKSMIEEFAMSINDPEANAAQAPMIRIKNENWKDILNLYDILITMLNNIPTITILISKMPLSFITNLVYSINTMDNEERILIKIIIYKIYISSLTYRKYIIKMLSNIIIDISHDENNKFLCLNECLTLLKCILLGAKHPISDYYLNLISNVICPLMKCKNICKQSILKDTLIKLMNFDSKACNVIVSFLLRTWPVRYPERIIIYLDIIETIFNSEEQKNILNEIEESTLHTVLNKIRCCFSDQSFLIADRSLIFFKNEKFIVLLYKYNLEHVFLSKLVENIEKHWSQEIRIISRIVISKIAKRDEKILLLLSEEEKKIVNDFKFDINESEDIWDIHFNLKGD